MKVLYYCPEYYHRHGGRTHAHGFFAALRNLPSVTGAFLYPVNNLQASSEASEPGGRKLGKVKVSPSTIRRILRFFRPRYRLTRELIDEINTHGCDALIVRTGAQYPVISKIKKACPRTVVCLEMNSAYFDEHLPKLPLKSVFQYWEVHRFKRADAVTVVSSYLRGYLEERGIPAEKILVNQNGVNPEIANITAAGDVREQYDIPRDVFVIGYIGGMEPFRRLPEVVRYIADLRRAGNRDVYLLLVGDGAEMPAVRTALEAERDVLQNSVILTGWVPHSEVPRYLATCSLAIFPFTNDYCSPLKLFEYLGAGIPTIGPDTPAVREVFQDGVHLKLVKQDGSDFVTSILEMRADPQLRARLSSQGQRLVLEEYTWERNAERVIQHIQKFVEPMTQTADTQ